MTTGYEWWWNKHAETGAPVLTYVHPATGLSVLPDAEWYQRDFTDRGREFNDSASFFEQLLPLRRSVPVLATLNIRESQNAIALFSYGDVDSFFVLACQSRNCFFSSDGIDIESSAEVYAVKHLNECYRVIFGERLFRCRYSMNCFDCRESAFLFDCRNCEFCFGATNKRNKKYFWFNEQLSKEEWERRRMEVDLSRRSVVKNWTQKFQELIKDAYWPESFNELSPNCLGEYLIRSINCRVAFMAFDGPKDSQWIAYSYGNSERNFMVLGALGSDNYASVSILEGANNKFGLNLTRCMNTEYCVNCIECEACFGCVGLYRKKFCVLNRQFTETEYWLKIDEIKTILLERGQYGEFFSPAFNSSYFLESVAGIDLGATKQDEEKYGFQSFDPESSGAVGELGDVTRLRDSETVPDGIDEINVDEWAGVAMFDRQSGRRFAFLRPELEFYKNQRIAPPTRHFIYRVDSLYLTANLFLLENAFCATCERTLRVAKNVTYKGRRHLCRDCYLRYLEEHG